MCDKTYCGFDVKTRGASGPVKNYCDIQTKLERESTQRCWTSEVSRTEWYGHKKNCSFSSIQRRFTGALGNRTIQYRTFFFSNVAYGQLEISRQKISPKRSKELQDSASCVYNQLWCAKQTLQREYAFFPTYSVVFW